MNIHRYKITGIERRSITNITRKVHSLHADQPSEAGPNVPTILLSLPRSAAVWGHSLQLESYEHDVSSLANLTKKVEGLRGEKIDILILEGLPIETNPSALLMLVGSFVSEVREYLGHGAAAIEISDKSKIEELRPSSDNNLHFDLHTDMSFYPEPPSFVCFLMLRTAASGGESIFCHVDTLVRSLSARAVATLLRPWLFPAPTHRPHDRPQLFPILTFGEKKRARMRYRRDGLEPANADQANALEELEREASRHTVEIKLRPAEMAIFSNTRLLHGRRAFVDQRGSCNVRSALRAYCR
jgi:hypothetical protein